MSNIDFDDNWTLLANSGLQLKNTKITGFWNRVGNCFGLYFWKPRCIIIFSRDFQDSKNLKLVYFVPFYF
ncbi:hypothetical protein ASJ81_12930 [Methanosarcina spelaei]|uniref:Uncharacterized protein n=1 Tax=Methanosarcina spelaei TaxID=1036679 RepID=A0A2A2HMJ7_9EURY|nr:hypothetical protein ASJ81_12930 [Methanosarcina spelaei]